MSSKIYEYKDTQDWYVGEWSPYGGGFYFKDVVSEELSRMEEGLRQLAVSYTHLRATRLGMISYAVFCLKKKISKHTRPTPISNAVFRLEKQKRQITVNS